MTLKEALELEFSKYIMWCHNYMAEAAVDPMVCDLWYGPHSGEFRVLIEAQWARRYWYHKNGVEAV